MRAYVQAMVLYAAVFVLVVSAFYGLGALVVWEPSPAKWDMGVRFLVFTFGFLFGLCTGGIAAINFRELVQFFAARGRVTK